MRLLAVVLLCACAAARTRKPEPASPLDLYLQQARESAAGAVEPSPGSLYSANGQLGDAARDLRARRLYDLVTIVVLDKLSALSSGATKSSRQSSAKASVNALAGPIKATRPLANLLTTSGQQQLQGEGTTSRDTSLTTTLTAQVIAVLPNGNMIVEGRKAIAVNSEQQVITLRGMVRPEDLTPSNSVSSDRVAMLEVKVNGKGVVADAVKRPFFLYRLLLGLLPF